MVSASQLCHFWPLYYSTFGVGTAAGDHPPDTLSKFEAMRLGIRIKEEEAKKTVAAKDRSILLESVVL